MEADTTPVELSIPKVVIEAEITFVDDKRSLPLIRNAR